MLTTLKAIKASAEGGKKALLISPPWRTKLCPLKIGAVKKNFA
ncbi:hypothetical protein HNP69_001719 [Chryseobacterium koreense]|nr:hypothetical protein [Chryseobacterium koreense]